MLYISTWISLRDIEEIYPKLRKEDFFKNSPIFKECEYDQRHHDILVKELIERNYVICGDTHQSYDYDCIPLFNDGYLMMSMRSWGAIMAEAMNIKLGEERYNYMNFYMASVCPIEEHRPGEGK